MSQDKGLYDKFTVLRADGSSESGGKHQWCRYFVLDIDHDVYAPAALREYARACKATNPKLSMDLLIQAEIAEKSRDGGKESR